MVNVIGKPTIRSDTDHGTMSSRVVQFAICFTIIVGVQDLYVLIPDFTFTLVVLNLGLTQEISTPTYVYIVTCKQILDVNKHRDVDPIKPDP